MKRSLQVAVALTALTATLAGCGAQAGMPLGSRVLTGVNAKGAAFSYSLGAEIAGTPTVAAEEAHPSQDALPALVDLRDQCQPVYNQGPFGSCTAFAIAKGLGEFVLKKEHRHTELSALFLWYQERKALHTLEKNSGAPISLGMKVLATVGAPPEADHPYPAPSIWKDEAALAPFLTQKPDTSDVADAKANRIAGLQPIGSLHAIKASLSRGLPVVFGFAVFESIKAAGKGGMLPMPDTAKEKMLGGHAVMCVGYDNKRELLIMRNSWGADWGDKGYFYMPYGFLKTGLVHDAWTAKL